MEVEVELSSWRSQLVGRTGRWRRVGLVSSGEKFRPIDGVVEVLSFTGGLKESGVFFNRVCNFKLESNLFSLYKSAH